MTSQVNPIPEGYHTVTPYLIVQEAECAVPLRTQSFGAVEHFRATGSAGGLHIEVTIGDSRVMLGGGGAWSGEPSPATLYLYMDDVDTIYQSALQAGASSIMEPADQSYGDRLAGVKDAFGNTWYIATHVEDVPM